MATITLTELLGTDNIALSRTDINQNFQTLENSVNTLETFLNTTPAGGELSVGNFIINLGAAVESDVLSTNNASALIQGGLTINGLAGTGFTVATTATVGTDLTVNNKLLVNGSGASAAITIGSAGNVPITLNDIVLIDTQVANTVATASAVETILNTGIFEVDVTNLRKVLLDYTALPAVSDPTSANYIRITGTPVVGQRVFFGISAVANPAAVANIYFDNSIAIFNAKYDAIPTPTPYNSVAAATVAAIGFGGATENEFTRQWVELIYTAAGWEVYQSHPSVLGL